MYIEKRKVGKNIKYYLVHSYRDDFVRKIRVYLGINLSDEKLKNAVFKSKERISKKLECINTKMFNFFLTKKQIERLNKYDKEIKIHHLDSKKWEIFTEEFVYNTNAIEGSTVGFHEVKEILEHNKQIKGPDEIEAKNVANAVKFIRETKQDLSISFIKKLHKLCFESSKPFAGKLRDVEVVIRDSYGNIIHSGVPAYLLNSALSDLIDWYKLNKKKFKPLILAAIIHNQFEHIHPFQDGNGRVGRLLLNFILIKNKYPPINILLEDRMEYYNSLGEYSKNHNLLPTLRFLITQYRKTLKQVTTKNKKA